MLAPLDRALAFKGETDTVAIIDPRHAAKQLIFERVFRSATLMAAILVLVAVSITTTRQLAWSITYNLRPSFVSTSDAAKLSL